MFSAMQIFVVMTMLGFAFCFSIKLMYFCVTPAISASFSCVIFFFNLLILIFSATFVSISLSFIKKMVKDLSK